MADHSGFDSEVFVYRGRGGIPRNVVHVEVDRNVKFIPDRLFENCRQLESVLLHEGLRRIGSRAFRRCSSLRGIKIPSTVTNIGRSAFSECSNLAAVEFPPGLGQIEAYTFSKCMSLVEANIPASVARIGNGAFHGCTNLSSIGLCEGVQMIGNWAFKNCRSLRELRVPSSVDEIGEEAFYGCTSLSLVLLHEDLPKMKPFAFKGCTSLECFQFVRLLERMKSIRMDDATKSMIQSRLREITNALTRGPGDREAAEAIWEKCKKSLERAHEVLTYLELNGSMPLLDLALWKAKIADEREGRLRGGLANDEDGGQDARDASSGCLLPQGRARQQGPQLSREDCRVKSGAGIVSAEVQKFLAYKTSWPRLDDLE